MESFILKDCLNTKLSEYHCGNKNLLTALQKVENVLVENVIKIQN